MQEKYFKPFCKKEEIETPALLIDMDKIEKNIKIAMDHYNSVKANIRPHFKAHKCPTLALKQIEAGAIGMTCAKVGEAEVLVKAGVKSILIANEIVSESKIKRLALLERHADVITSVDSLKNVQDISRIACEVGVKIGVVIEIDVGLHRCGVKSIEEGVALAKEIVKLPGVVFRGVMGYEGHCNKYIELKKRTEEVVIANALLADFKKAVEAAGIPVEIVSAGGTCMFDITTRNPEITEVQAGAYLLMATKWSDLEGMPFEQAETILSTVISVPNSEYVTIDAGIKCYSTEAGPPSVKDHKGMEIVKISEEHTTFKLHEGAPKFKVGDK
ncbi:MAG TPA: alanine racemase, partial [Clostridia bacterium]|nr:alanine racemase [Clostridia bacterium]